MNIAVQFPAEQAVQPVEIVNNPAHRIVVDTYNMGNLRWKYGTFCWRLRDAQNRMGDADNGESYFDHYWSLKPEELPTWLFWWERIMGFPFNGRIEDVKGGETDVK